MTLLSMILAAVAVPEKLPPLFSVPTAADLSADQFGTIYAKCLISELNQNLRTDLDEKKVTEEAIELCSKLAPVWFVTLPSALEQFERMKIMNEDARRTFPDRVRWARKIRLQIKEQQPPEPAKR